MVRLGPGDGREHAAERPRAGTDPHGAGIGHAWSTWRCTIRRRRRSSCTRCGSRSTQRRGSCSRTGTRELASRRRPGRLVDPTVAAVRSCSGPKASGTPHHGWPAAPLRGPVPRDRTGGSSSSPSEKASWAFSMRPAICRPWWPHPKGCGRRLARRVVLAPGRRAQFDPLWISAGDPGARYSEYADLWAAEASARRDGSSPLGWCSWYQYFSRVTPEDIRQNLELARRHGVALVQIDDGYQRAIGDWLLPRDGWSGANVGQLGEIERLAEEIQACRRRARDLDRPVRGHPRQRTGAVAPRLVRP